MSARLREVAELSRLDDAALAKRIAHHRALLLVAERERLARAAVGLPAPTASQGRLLVHLVAFAETRGRMPTIDELAGLLGCWSNAAHSLAQLLAAKGYLELARGRTAGWRVLALPRELGRDVAELAARWAA